MTAPQSPEPDHAHFMQRALQLGAQAAAVGEVPVGAVVVHQGVVVGEGFNQCMALNDPTAHAEMQALRAAAAHQRNYRLEDCDLYVTLEPCAMCAQALLHARVRHVFFGAPEPRFGAAGSVLNLFALPALNPHTGLTGGVLEAEGRALLQSFFRERRAEQAQARHLPENAPLREDALRTPDARFVPLQGFVQALDEALAGYQLQRQHHAFTHLEGLEGLRLHVVELAPARQAATDEHPLLHPLLHLLLHSPDGWWPESALMALAAQSAAERPRLPARWLLPDLIGFGQSDKPKKTSWHCMPAHVAYLLALLEATVQPQSGAVEIGFSPEQGALARALQQAAAGSEVLKHCAVQLTAVASAAAGTCPATTALAGSLPASWRELPFPDRGHEAARRGWDLLPSG